MGFIKRLNRTESDGLITKILIILFSLKTRDFGWEFQDFGTPFGCHILIINIIPVP